MITFGGGAQFLSKPGPQLRVQGPSVAVNSASIPNSLSLTVPTSTQVDDYIIVCTSNITAVYNAMVPNRWTTRYGFTASGTYNEFVTIWILMATSADIGATLSFHANGFSFNAIMDIFTNPNKSNLAHFISGSTDVYEGRYKIPVAQNMSTGNTTSITRTDVITNDIPSNYLRYTAAAANGASANPSIGYSGSGAFRQQRDSYWWRAAARVYEANSSDTGNVGTFTASTPSAIATASILLW